MILITGASGSVGKAVLLEAIRRESKVRAMYRSKEEAAKAPSGCQAVLADYADKHSLGKALDGGTVPGQSALPAPGRRGVRSSWNWKAICSSRASKLE